MQMKIMTEEMTDDYGGDYDSDDYEMFDTF
jgi:hypothetical protein